jgi:hypothetical protein
MSLQPSPNRRVRSPSSNEPDRHWRPLRGAEREALYAMLVSLGATKLMAERLMEDYPHHAGACQAIVDFASDGESDIRGAIAQLEEDEAPRRWRGGAT